MSSDRSSTRGSLSASSRRRANQDHKPQTQFRLRTDEHNDTVIDRNESSVTWIQSKLRSAAFLPGQEEQDDGLRRSLILTQILLPDSAV